MTTDKIVGILRPFDRRQNFYVYKDGNKVDKISVTLDEMNNSIFALSEKYQITRLDLTGPKQYARGIAKQLQEAEMIKYEKNILEINII